MDMGTFVACYKSTLVLHIVQRDLHVHTQVTQQVHYRRLVCSELTFHLGVTRMAN